MLGDIEVHHATPIVRQDDEDVEESQTNRCDSEEVDTNCPIWLRRNVIQVGVGLLSFGINREIVRSEISNPSLNNSP